MLSVKDENQEEVSEEEAIRDFSSNTRAFDFWMENDENISQDYLPES
jgi:hypothetical protein